MSKYIVVYFHYDVTYRIAVPVAESVVIVSSHKDQIHMLHNATMTGRYSHRFSHWDHNSVCHVIMELYKYVFGHYDWTPKIGPLNGYKMIGIGKKFLPQIEIFLVLILFCPHADLKGRSIKAVIFGCSDRSDAQKQDRSDAKKQNTR